MLFRTLLNIYCGSRYEMNGAVFCEFGSWVRRGWWIGRMRCVMGECRRLWRIGLGCGISDGSGEGDSDRGHSTKVIQQRKS